MALKKDKNFIIRVSDKLLEDFKEFCEDNSMNASKRIRKYMENDVEAWRRKKEQQQRQQ